MIPFSSLKVDPQGLIPCIVIDAQSKSVLMQAFMNETAFEQTIRTGQMTYYSRSRGKLWIKGETSGNRQSLVRFFPDCDKDCLLFEVIQQGPACHTGSDSCFYKTIPKLRVDALLHLEDVIAERRSNPIPGAYTTYLFQSGLDKILKKVGEEASEVLIASKNDDPNALLGEIADLMYHLHVLLAEKGLHFSEVTEVLASRMTASPDTN